MADPRTCLEALRAAVSALETYLQEGRNPAALPPLRAELGDVVQAAGELAWPDVARVAEACAELASGLSGAPADEAERALGAALGLILEAAEQAGGRLPACEFVLSMLAPFSDPLAVDEETARPTAESAAGSSAAPAIQGAVPAAGADPAAAHWLGLVTSEDLGLFESFAAECQENLAALESSLLRLEREPADRALYTEAFRPIHNLKGTGGFLGLEQLSAACHGAESLLDFGRSGRAVLEGEQVDLLFALHDLIRDTARNLSLAVDVRRGAQTSDPFTLVDARELIDRLTSAAARLSVGLERPAPARDDEAADSAAMQAAEDLRLGSRVVKVDARNLDELLDTVGELVIAHSVVEHLPSAAGGRAARRAVEEVTRIVSRLQDLVMSLRLLPVRHVFARMERLVRDLARSTGKRVELSCAGEETEVDKTILEQLHDPLIHLLRNAVDHGIEPPAEREASGKPPVGTVRLQARHEGGFLVVDIDDDGRGIDLDRLREKVREEGGAADVDERELLRHIFQAGFSTAEVAGPLSGRGVGLDVVWQRVRELGGRVEVSPHGPLGGASFSVRMPLTTAIIDGLVVRVAGERYVLPSAGVIVTTRLQDGRTTAVSGLSELLDLHGHLIPVIHLAELFDLGGSDGASTVVVVGDETRRCGLLVERVLGRQQVVVKGLQGVTLTQGISAGAILGDGSVALILDVAGLLEAGGQWRALADARA